jgi:hypothetical protein
LIGEAPVIVLTGQIDSANPVTEPIYAFL